MADLRHTINIAAQRSGLSMHVIRIWEKRYGCVTPDRTATNRRLYTDGDIHRLTLLRRATEAGHRIANIAGLPETSLETLAVSREPAASPTAATGPNGGGHGAPFGWSPEQALRRCLDSIRSFDGEGLEKSLTEAVLRLGHQGMLCKLAAPLTRAMGDAWRRGELTVAHEHAASNVLRQFLLSSAKPFALSPSSPTLVVATPPGQAHELGAVMVAALASNLGWKVTYLGAQMPAEELAGAVRQNQARAVALSLVYPFADPAASQCLRDLRRYLAAPFPILVGGQAVESHARAVRESGALVCGDLEEVQTCLDRLLVETSPDSAPDQTILNGRSAGN